MEFFLNLKWGGEMDSAFLEVLRLDGGVDESACSQCEVDAGELLLGNRASELVKKSYTLILRVSSRFEAIKEMHGGNVLSVGADLDRQFIEVAKIPARNREDFSAKVAVASTYIELCQPPNDIATALLSSICEDVNRVS
ncbi:hypothetical protein WOB59_00760 [Methylocystis sp. IM4]|uniref:hypothetical protein n=1 Tax=Methylocystis sp. IM4 TaxID=3136560 RepID=UPI00311A6343